MVTFLRSLGAPKSSESKSCDADAYTSPLEHMYAPWASPSLGAVTIGSPRRPISSLEDSRISGVILEVCWALVNALRVSPSSTAFCHSFSAFSLLSFLSLRVPIFSSCGFPSKTNIGSMPDSMRLAVR